MKKMAEISCGKCGAVPVRGLVTLIGSMLVLFALGNGYTFGNMTTYMTSYLRLKSLKSGDTNYGQTLWISTGNIIGSSTFMPVVCLLEQKIPSRLCIFIGGVVYSLAVALTYFSVHHSVIVTVMSYGVLYSMGKSLVYPITMRLALRWFPDNKGLVSGILEAGYAGSAFALNQIITSFINPANLSPDLNVKGSRYFSQESVLSRVPYCFFLLGGIYLVLYTLGVLLMRVPPDEETSIQEKSDASTHTSIEDAEGCTAEEFREITRGEEEQPIEKPTQHTTEDESSHRDLTPIEALKTSRFYIAWLTYFFFGFALDVFFALFKSYGQAFIADDRFLSLTASFSSAASALGNLFWGYISDRFGYKVSLMGLVTMFGVFLSTLNTTEYGGKPMFFIWICAINFSLTGICVLLPVIAMDMFGNKYYSVIYGLIHSAGVVYSTLSSLLTSNLRTTLGWHGLFFVAGGMSFMSCILTAVIYLKKMR